MVQSTPSSIGGGNQREQSGGQLLHELETLSQALYHAGQRKDDNAVEPSSKLLSRRETMPARRMSEGFPPSVNPATAVKSPRLRPPIPGKSTPSPSADGGRKPDTYRLDHPRAGSESPGRLQPWHSQGFEKNMPEVTNFPEWLEDNLDFSQKLEAPAEKKKGLWGWRPFRAIAHMGQQKYNVLFTVHVHGIEGLPATMNGLRLTVHFAKKDEAGVQTMPSRIFQGSAEFEETLNLRCSVHGSKNNMKNMKWEYKQFNLSVIALDVDELVLGKHRLELTRLLPENLEEDEEKQDTWTTSFKLTGKAKGGTLVVTFGCEIQNKDSQNASATSSSRFGESPVLKAVHSFNSSHNSGDGTPLGRHLDSALSPMSEPSADHVDYGMEHLSLDDSHDSPYSNQKGQMRPEFQPYPGEDSKLFSPGDSMLAPPTPGQSAEGLGEVTKVNHHKEVSEDVHAGSGEEEDEDAEFTVVDQGVELGTITDSFPTRRSSDVEAEDRPALLEEQAGQSLDVSTQGEEEVEADDASERADNQIGERELGLVQAQDEAEVSWQGGAESDMEYALKAHEEVVDEEDYADGERAGAVKIRSLSEDLQEGRNSEHLEDGPSEDELEMQELLDALDEREVDVDVEERVDTSLEYEYTHGGDSRAWASQVSYSPNQEGPATEDPEQDEMTEEELLSLLPAEEEPVWELETVVTKSRVAESDDEFDPVAGEFLDLLETQAGPLSSVALMSDSEPDSPRAMLLKQFEQEAMLESGLGLDMEMEAPLYMDNSEVPDLYLDGLSSDSSCDGGLVEDGRELPLHKTTLSEDFNCLGWGSEEDMELASIMEAAESELQKATQTMRSKNRAKMLEDAETEALMLEWGLNKKVFEGSPPHGPILNDYGNPYAMIVADAPALGAGVGPVVQTRDGGSLRSMSPANFQATSSGRLVMQVSKPVVVPVDMGSTSMDILRRMAAAGMEGMADQAAMAMPLEDITGKSVEQIASEGFAALEGSYQGRGQYGYPALEGGQPGLVREYGEQAYSGRGALSTRGDSGLATTSRGGSQRRNRGNPNLGDDTFTSLQDLAPMAMQKIEALALDGLKVQADMAEDEAPYMVEPLSWDEMRAIEGGPMKRKGGKPGEISTLDGVTAMRLLEGGSTELGGSDDGLSMAISLDEWMRLDAGVYDEHETTANTGALLAAHQANHGDMVVGKQKDGDQGAWGRLGDKQGSDATNLKGGFMGDTLTLAMLVQLRDPLRNYEPVGAPMMALVQAERVMLPPKVKLGRRISIKGNTEDDDDVDVPSQPQFKIMDVTMSGLKTKEETVTDEKKQIGWGNQKQQQSGSRWLVASGMAKTAKHPVLQSRAAPSATPVVQSKPTKADSLWSISSKPGSKWGAPAAAKTRNPDVAIGRTGWFGRKK